MCEISYKTLGEITPSHKLLEDGNCLNFTGRVCFHFFFLTMVAFCKKKTLNKPPQKEEDTQEGFHTNFNLHLLGQGFKPQLFQSVVFLLKHLPIHFLFLVATSSKPQVAVHKLHGAHCV